MAPLILPSLLVAISGLQLERVGEIEGCPLWQHLPRSLDRVLPTLPVGMEPTEGDVLIALEPVPGGARLRLTNTLGNTLLIREIPVEAELCYSVTDVIALITERYLRDIGWEPTHTGLPDLPRGTRGQKPMTFTWTPRFEGLDVGLRAATEVAQGPVSPRWGGSLSLRVPFSGWEVGLNVGGWAPVRKAVRYDDERRGRIEVWSIDGRLGVGLCGGDSGHRLCGALQGGVEWLSGRAAGERVFQVQSGSMLQPLAGVEAHYEYAMSQVPLGFLVAASMVARPRQAGFDVEDAAPAYKTPFWAARLEMGLWWQIL
ncbi:hypothetical protein ACFL6C_06775 [Myxococcota bacterium]